MLLRIIEETLEKLEIENSQEILSKKIHKDIKNLAKKLFFDGQVNSLKDFIFDIDNENNVSIKNLFLEILPKESGEEFLDFMKGKIQGEVVKYGKAKNIESLLEVLDYGHLRGFLSLFKI